MLGVTCLQKVQAEVQTMYCCQLKANTGGGWHIGREKISQVVLRYSSLIWRVLLKMIMIQLPF